MMDHPKNGDLSYSDGPLEQAPEETPGDAPEETPGDAPEETLEDAPIDALQEGERKEASPKGKPIRILGLDYGSKTVGIALSDPLGLTAQPLETIRREQENKLRRTLARILQLCEEHSVTLIVLGLPKNLDNSLGTRAEWTLEFAQKLKARTNLPVELWDERLSTNQADRILELSGVHKKDRKVHLDQMAAAIILQSYLDAHTM